MAFIKPRSEAQYGSAGEPQSERECEDCVFFEHSIAYDEPCGLCYESADKFNFESIQVD